MLENISYKIFEKDNPKACILIVHGMMEHKERYNEFAEYLNENDFAVFTYDLPGHGDSCQKEDRGYFGAKNGWSNLVNSSFEMVRLAKEKYPYKPIIYLGHSMGTMIGRCFLQKYDNLIDAMILSGAPVYNKAAPLGKLIAQSVIKTNGKKGRAKVLSKLALGSFNANIVNPRTPVDWLSSNEETINAYLNDEKCNFSFTNQGYYDLFNGMTKMHKASLFRVNNPDLPIYFFGGEDDPCLGGLAGVDDSVDSLKEVGYKHIDIKLYPGLRHETLNEKCREDVYKDVLEWIKNNVNLSS